SLARMVGVITSIDPASSPGTGRPADSSIRLEQVSHAYGEDADGVERIVLRPIDLDIAPGEVVSLVGASRAGKPTLAAPPAGTPAPRHGRLLPGGPDLARAALEAVRSHAAIVSQDVHVFRGTLREDLQLAAPEATDEELRSALRRVDALGWAD